MRVYDYPIWWCPFILAYWIVKAVVVLLIKLLRKVSNVYVGT